MSQGATFGGGAFGARGGYGGGSVVSNVLLFASQSSFFRSLFGLLFWVLPKRNEPSRLV